MHDEMERMMQFTEAQRAFLDQPLSAVVATHRAGGTTAQSVVWYMPDGDTIWFSTGPESAKVRQLRRDPRISFLVISADGGTYLAIEGTATITVDVETPDRLNLWRRYRGDEAAQAIAARPLPGPNARVRIHPTRVFAYNIPE
jgi:PPOX class probable F420-dependent enzyme